MPGTTGRSLSSHQENTDRSKDRPFCCLKDQRISLSAIGGKVCPEKLKISYG
jgi:hypothetical protein